MKTLGIVLLFAFLAVATAAKSETQNRHDIDIPLVLAEDGCDCSTYDSCACCAWDIPVIDDVCVNITWHDYTVYTYLIINDEIVAQREITDTRGPVDICASVGCDVCIQMQNLNISTTGACGSIYLNVTCSHFAREQDLGDWSLGEDCTIPKEEVKESIVELDDVVVKVQPRSQPVAEKVVLPVKILQAARGLKAALHPDAKRLLP